jgi:hypothetical protein
MIELLAALCIEIDTSLWAGWRSELRVNDFFIQSKTMTRIEQFESNVWAFNPDIVSYTNSIGYITNDLEFKLTEQCTHGIDHQLKSSEINWHEFSIRRYNKQKI